MALHPEKPWPSILLIVDLSDLLAMVLSDPPATCSTGFGRITAPSGVPDKDHSD